MEWEKELDAVLDPELKRQNEAKGHKEALQQVAQRFLDDAVLPAFDALVARLTSKGLKAEIPDSAPPTPPLHFVRLDVTWPDDTELWYSIDADQLTERGAPTTHTYWRFAGGDQDAAGKPFTKPLVELTTEDVIQHFISTLADRPTASA